jgi:hypothetical protein
MNLEQLGVRYAGLGQQERVRFLVQLLNKLTVTARETYAQGEIKDPSRVIGINEFQHRLSRIALDAIDGRTIRTDAEVAEYLFVGFTDLGVIKVLEDALSSSGAHRDDGKRPT